MGRAAEVHDGSGALNTPDIPNAIFANVILLVESHAKKGENMYMGRTRGYRKVVFPGNERLLGELIPVSINDASVSTLIASADILETASL